MKYRIRSDETGLNYVSNSLITYNYDMVIFPSLLIFQQLILQNRLVLSSHSITVLIKIIFTKQLYLRLFFTQVSIKVPFSLYLPLSPVMASPYSVMWSPWRNKMEVEPQPVSKDIRPST